MRSDAKLQDSRSPAWLMRPWDAVLQTASFSWQEGTRQMLAGWFWLTYLWLAGQVGDQVSRQAQVLVLCDECHCL